MRTTKAERLLIAVLLLVGIAVCIKMGMKQHDIKIPTITRTTTNLIDSAQSSYYDERTANRNISIGKNNGANLTTGNNNVAISYNSLIGIKMDSSDIVIDTTIKK